MSEKLFVATRKGLFTVEKKSGAWKITDSKFLGDNCTIVLPDNRDNSVYVAIGHGHFGVKMHRSKDGGKSWEECGVPTYPEQPAGEVDLDPFRKTPIPWKTIAVWSMAAGGPQEKGVLWAGTIPGGLFRSKDSGSTWTLIRTLWDNPKRKFWVGGGADYPGVHSICVHPKNPRQVTIAVSCGGVWETKDGGETWDLPGTGLRAEYAPPELQYEPNGQDPHIIVQCQEKPEAFWCQHHNGVFRTVDGAKKWTELTNVKPSVFGFAVAVHPKDPETAWFVPAVKDEKRYPVDGKVVVSRTRDGGKSFEVLRKGLPQEHAYDLTYRHCLDIDETGNRLSFGTTTGSLWLTEDQGDSWQTVSEHLPPVYCVRFMK